MLSKSRINTQLKSISNGVDSRLESLVKTISDRGDSILNTKATSVGSSPQGILVIADEGLSKRRNTREPVVGVLYDNSTSEIVDSIRTISSQKANIATLTGVTVEDGFLQASVTSMNPKGLKSTLETMAPKPDVETLYKAASTNPDEVLKAIEDEENGGYHKQFTDQYQSVRGGGTSLSTIVGGTIKGNVQNDIPLTIKSSRDAIVVNTREGFLGLGTPSTYEFTFVNTIEELSLEFRNSLREFTNIIVEFTGEYSDDNFDAIDFQQLYSTGEYRDKGYDGIPYHYLIRKDGKIQRGRPIDIETVRPSSVSYANSIVIAIPGGFNSPFGTDDAYQTINSSTTTSWYSFNKLLKIAYTMYPGILVFASEELEQLGWDADTYIKSLFSKRNNLAITSDNITREQLINART